MKKLINYFLKFSCLLMMLIAISSCSQKYSKIRAASDFGYASEMKFQDPEVISQSLFNAKESTISEEDIQRLLDGKIQVKENLRIAVLDMNSSSSYNNRYRYYWNNEESLKSNKANFEILRDALMTTTRAKKVFLLPNIVVTQNASLQQLRESAVRMQADMLLIYYIKSDLYQKYKMFKKNEVKAFASCEALLLDVRTGVIPFSDVSTDDALIQKGDEDFNNEETQKRAISDATKKTLNGLAQNLVNYFKNEL